MHSIDNMVVETDDCERTRKLHWSPNLIIHKHEQNRAFWSYVGSATLHQGRSLRMVWHDGPCTHYIPFETGQSEKVVVTGQSEKVVVGQTGHSYVRNTMH